MDGHIPASEPHDLGVTGSLHHDLSPLDKSFYCVIPMWSTLVVNGGGGLFYTALSIQCGHDRLSFKYELFLIKLCEPFSHLF